MGGSTFQAIELHKERSGEFDYDTKHNFYAGLASVSLYHAFYDTID
jgi:hypothetical protein